MRWRTEPWNKVMLALYINFTWQQEVLSPGLRGLRNLLLSSLSRLPIFRHRLAWQLSGLVYR